MLGTAAASLACRPRLRGAPIDAQFTEPYLIEITGSEKRWHIRYPGADGVLHTVDDVCDRRNVHLPAATRVVLLLRSTDYVYTLSLPRSAQRQIAVPERQFSLSCFECASGRYPLVGDQFCGDDHPELVGELIVLPCEQFANWLQQNAS